ncbi:MAG TPA: hypothetical protein VFS64_06820 [Solirubrobacterales bacterium]|nr:hypothetical protein [Solirubrobacterales bacterium]
MKHLKMLGLAALAVMGLMAFLGAGTASATELQINTTPSANSTCGSAPHDEGCTIEATLEAGTSATLSDTFRISVDTCTASTVEGRIEDASAAGNPTGRISTLTFGGCSDTTTVVRNGSLEIEHIAGTTNGTVTSKEAEVEVFSTALGATCRAVTGTGTSLGTLTGAGHGLTNATMDINATITMEGCGISSGKWVGRYEVTSPTGLTVE